MIFNYLENHCDHSFHPYDSLYINYHMYISINRFLFVFHPLIWIVTMIIRYDMICDCIIINYQILSPLLISIILLFSLFITMCIGFISIPHYLTKLIFIIIVVQNGNIVYPYSKSSHSSSNILYHHIHIIFDKMIQNITLNIQYILDDGSSFNWFNYSSYWYPYCINTLNLSLSIKISHPVTDSMCVGCSGYTTIFDIQQSTTSNHCK